MPSAFHGNSGRDLHHVVELEMLITNILSEFALDLVREYRAVKVRVDDCMLPVLMKPWAEPLAKISVAATTVTNGSVLSLYEDGDQFGPHLCRYFCILSVIVRDTLYRPFQHIFEQAPGGKYHIPFPSSSK